MSRRHEQGGEQPSRRFREATDGPFIRRWYARVRTSELARVMGLTERKIEDFIYREKEEKGWYQWGMKSSSLRSRERSDNGTIGGRKRWHPDG